MAARFLAKSMVALFALVLVAGAGLATPAQARVFVGFGVGPFWGAPYPYPYPYGYPYPYYAPPVVYSPGYVPADPGYAPAPAAAPPTWYYCDNPAGYYPYVQQCNEPWRPVAATPRQ